MRPLLVYVHFPWCLEKCPYCDFVSYRTTREAIDQRGYTEAVLAELRARLGALRASGDEWSLASVFIGGGTPSLWEPEQLGRLLAALRAELPAVGEVEVTAECNPSSLDRERAEALAGAGVNRLSIGVQSLDADRLKFLGRLHDGPGAVRAVRDALDSGIGRVSADLIYAVAGQRPEEAVDEASRLLDLGLTHLSAYSLTIEAGTRFGELARRGRLPLADDGASIETFFALHEALGARGLGHYEVSNYAAPGQESRHNLGYWQGHLYLGLGCAAVGATPAPGGQVVRYRNQPVPERYMAAVAREAPLFEADGLPDSAESLDPETRLRERIMLGLRLASGFDLEEAAASLGVDPWPPARRRAAERMIQRGRLARDGGRIWAPVPAWSLVDGTAAELFLRGRGAQRPQRPGGRLAAQRPRGGLRGPVPGRGESARRSLGCWSRAPGRSRAGRSLV